MPRAPLRGALGLPEDDLPFAGDDLWTAYELSWLGPTGRPEVAILELTVPARSPCIVESKSLKLYLGSLAQHRFAAASATTATIERDLAEACGATVQVLLTSPAAYAGRGVSLLPGESIDDCDIAPAGSAPSPGSLRNGAAMADESLRCALFRSMCPVTAQPDHADVLVRYRGRAIDRGSLLAYLVSFRQHPAFHEQCVEQIFVDLLRQCRPAALTVHAKFTRRGGIAIAPFRSNFETRPGVERPTPRQ